MKGIDWAFDAGARVMNMSFTGPMDPLLERIVKAAADKGVIFIAAAGNNGPKGAPRLSGGLSAGDCGHRHRRQGQTLRQSQSRRLHLASPRRASTLSRRRSRARYELASGTSMAAAHVSGVVALLIERDGKLDWSKARDILSSSARKPDGSSEEDAFGAGILDAAGALGESAIESSPFPPWLRAATIRRPCAPHLS